MSDIHSVLILSSEFEFTDLADLLLELQTCHQLALSLTLRICQHISCRLSRRSLLHLPGCFCSRQSLCNRCSVKLLPAAAHLLHFPDSSENQVYWDQGSVLQGTPGRDWHTFTTLKHSDKTFAQRQQAGEVSFPLRSRSGRPTVSLLSYWESSHPTGCICFYCRRRHRGLMMTEKKWVE